MTVWCATPGCLPRGADGPAPAQDGYLLCHHHVDHIALDADKLGQLHVQLAEQLAMAGNGDGAVAGGTHAGLRLDVAAAAARHDIRKLLVELTRVVIAVRGEQWPWPWELDERHTGLMGNFVGDNARWLAARPNAGDTSDRLGYLRRRAHAITTQEPTSIVQIGPCPMLVLPGTPCRGQVRALVRRTDALLPLQVTCEDPEHAWPVEELARLGRWIGLKRGRWMSAAELAAVYAKPIRRIHQLASLHAWNRTRDGLRPVLYSAADAYKTFHPNAQEPTGEEPGLRLVGGRA